MTAAAEKQLNIILRLRNEVTKEVKRINKDVERMGRDGKKAVEKLSKGFDRVRRFAMKAVGAIKGMINPLTLLGGAIGVGAVVRLSQGLSEAAAMAEELESKFDAVFKDRAPDMRRYVDELSQGVKRGRQQILQMTSDMQPFFTAMGFASDEAERFTKATVQLAIDWASFTNQDDLETLQLMRSALVGNTEALDRFGARFSAAQVQQEALRLGLVDANAELGEQEKIMARLSLLFTRLPDAIGDAERTSGSFTNRMKELRGVVQDVRVEFGQRLNRAILEGLDDAGGVQQVKALTRTFNAAIAEFASVGVRAAAEVARTVGQILDRFGGADGVIERIQQRGDLLAKEIRLFGLQLRDTVAEFISGLEGFADALRTVGILDARDPALERSLFENLERRRDLEARFLELEVKRLDAQSSPMMGQRLMAGQVSAQQDVLVQELRTLEKIIERQMERSRLESEIAQIRSQMGGSPVSGTSILPGMFFGDADSIPMGPREVLSTADAIQDATAAAAEGYGRAAGEVERARAAVEALNQEVDESALFAERQVGQFTTAFLGLATGAVRAKDAMRQFFQSFIFDLLRVQANSAFNSLFGGAFGALYGVVNPTAAAPFDPTPGGLNVPGPVLPGPSSGFDPGGSLVAGPISPFAKGGIAPGRTTGFMPLKGYATGGPIVDAPHVALIGEGQHNEAIVPLPDGRSIPVQMKGGGGVVNNFYIEAVDTQSFYQALDRDPDGFSARVSRSFARDYVLKAQVGGRL